MTTMMMKTKKQLSAVLDKIIDSSEPLKALAGGLKSLALTTEKIATNLYLIAQNQATHHQMIMQLVQNQHDIAAQLRASSLDANMPDIDEQKVDVNDANAVAKAKAAMKPN